MAITPSTPSAAPDSWTTPARPGDPSVPGPADQPTAGEALDPVVTLMDGPTGDTVASTVQGAVDNAVAHYTSHQADIGPQGSAYGTLMGLPAVVSDTSRKTGGTDATSYDPAG